MQPPEGGEFTGKFIDAKREALDVGVFGFERLYSPTDEARAATDWMVYQRPDENWVELDFA